MSDVTPETVVDVPEDAPENATVDETPTLDERMAAVEAILSTPVFSRGNESATDMVGTYVPYAGEAV